MRGVLASTKTVQFVQLLPFSVDDFHSPPLILSSNAGAVFDVVETKTLEKSSLGLGDQLSIKCTYTIV